jgi:putative transposase
VLAAIADDHGAVELVANPAPLTRALRRLEAAQQALAACQKGSNRRRRARQRVTRIHQQARQLRRQAAHQLSARLVDSYDLIAIEDLRITNMTRSARGTLDAPPAASSSAGHHQPHGPGRATATQPEPCGS